MSDTFQSLSPSISVLQTASIILPGVTSHIRIPIPRQRQTLSHDQTLKLPHGINILGGLNLLNYSNMAVWFVHKNHPVSVSFNALTSLRRWPRFRTCLRRTRSRCRRVGVRRRPWRWAICGLEPCRTATAGSNTAPTTAATRPLYQVGAWLIYVTVVIIYQ